MRNIYGVYITFRFFKWLFGSTYGFFYKIFFFFYKEQYEIKMLEDKN